MFFFIGCPIVRSRYIEFDIDISYRIGIVEKYRLFRYIAINKLNLQQYFVFRFSNQLNYLQKFQKELGMNNFSIFSRAASSSSSSSLLYAFVIIDTRQRQVTINSRVEVKT